MAAAAVAAAGVPQGRPGQGRNLGDRQAPAPARDRAGRGHSAAATRLSEAEKFPGLPVPMPLTGSQCRQCVRVRVRRVPGTGRARKSNGGPGSGNRPGGR